MMLTDWRHTPLALLAHVALLAFLWAVPATAAPSESPKVVVRGNNESLPGNLLTAKETGQIRLHLREGFMLQLPGPAAQVLVAAPGVASFQMPAPDKAFLFGQEVGATTFYALNARGEIIAAVRIVVEYNLERLTREISSAVPGAEVELEPTLSNLMIVRGKVQTAIDAKRVIDLVESYLEAGSTGNINAASAEGGGRGGGGNRSNGDSPSNKTQVINQLRVEMSSQVNIQVRVVEVTRSLSRELGFDWRTVLSTSKGPLYFGTGNAKALYSVAAGTETFGGLMPSGSGGAIGGAMTFGQFSLSGLISALSEEGFASLLAEPNLTAMSGESASFAGGGEVPVVIVTGNSISIDYKSYGVILRMTPTVLSSNRISLHIAPEVSELTAEGAVALEGGSIIPALTVRRAETTVELASGQSFALAGMLRSNSSQQVSGVPGLRSIPLLGHLFEHEETSVTDSELVIIVTANVVDPVAYADLRTPGKGIGAVDAFLPRDASVGYLY
ncbi:type II and III secretion system protein family protein [Pseudodesulfovibrio sp. F-1]|uniref:Type II and III secretion system protein family protein n=1 Tax=Pseudodesulfovibrio alkaliphilus TaxID=2661613 RepID=A0A7K1KR13_9BACT|nr:pilus assembly protein N-terminal domain-containing protein [Pseudodesulfovibrio alkaliphilus]MUM78536.1 type II and III secretion system protein family protein [Pseudodesulfovibrio alkaliphilus]